MRRSIFPLAVVVLAIASIAATLWERDWLERSIRSDHASIDELGRGLDHHDPSVGRVAADQLGKRGNPPEAVIRSLIEALEEPTLCAQASNSLVRLGASAVPALIETMSDESPQRRWRSAVVLSRIGPAARSAVKALVVAMTGDEDPKVRYRSAEALGEVGENTPELLSALRGAVSDGSYRVRIEAAHALGRLRPPAAAFVQILKELVVDDPHPRVRREVAVVLGDRGAEAAAAAPELLTAYMNLFGVSDGSTSFVSRERDLTTSDALGRTEPRPEWLEDFAFRATGRSGCQDEYEEALIRIGPAIVPFLEEAAAGGDEETRVVVCRMCGYFGSFANSAAPMLLQALNDESPKVRSEAAYSLGRVSHDTSSSKDTVTPLIRALDDESVAVRTSAVEGLGLLGPAARSAIPALSKAQQNNVSRQKIAEALKRIQAPD